MTPRSSSLTLMALLAAAACSSNNPVGPADINNPSFSLIAPPAGPDPQGERIVVCKVGGEGTYDFTWSGTDFDPGPGTPIGGAFSLLPGQCWDLGFFGGSGASVDITETPRTGHEVVSIAVDYLTGTDLNLTGTNTVTGVVASGEPKQSALVTFTNRVLPPPGGEGCTPGYWKNHADSWPATGYAPSQTAGSVFTIPGGISSLASKTLLQTLNGGGGSGAIGGAKILLRAATAGLLNASHPGVAYTTSASDLITAVNAALATGERSVMIALAASIDHDNNLGCPLN